MTDDSYLDITPGIHEFDNAGVARALIEQQRSGMIELLRTSGNCSVTLWNAQGQGRHWAIADEEDTTTFLLYVAVKALRDAAAGMGCSTLLAAGLALKAIDAGVGAGDDA